MSKDTEERKIKKAIQKAGDSIFKLNPQMKNGVLRAGGRLVNAPIDEDMRHPIILPYVGHVTDLIIDYYHVSIGHMGQESVLSSLRKKFWIVKGRSAMQYGAEYGNIWIFNEGTQDLVISSWGIYPLIDYSQTILPLRTWVWITLAH